MLYVENNTGSATGPGQVTVNGGTLGGSGAIAGSVTLAAGAAIAPGNSHVGGYDLNALDTGSVTFASGGTLECQIMTDAPVELAADRLNINGALTINAGALLDLTDLATGNSYATLGDKFTLIRYNTAAWNGQIFAGYPDDATFTLGDYSFRLNYNDVTGGSNFNFGSPPGNYVTLTVTAAPADADFNRDGFVDGDDLLIWQRGVGRTGHGWHPWGDANRDRVIDAADLDVWRSQFGPVPEANATSTPVPEPGSLPLCLIAAAACALRSSRLSGRR